jgi:prepilin-type N-terminal cleavage/methylation domain-containing protein
METRRHETKGFTLIELLAVICILALLISLILPALTRAKGKARQAACLNNLRQINVAVHLYTDDFSGVFPISGSNWSGAFTRCAVLAKSYLGVAEGPSDHPRIFACPADIFYYDFETTARIYCVAQSLHGQADANYSSYAFNAGNFPYGWPPLPRWPGIAGLKATEVNQPGGTVLVAEDTALYPYSWHEPAAIPGCHNDAKCELTFVDGHASYLKIYWDAANAKGTHLEAWQYDPPPGYGYQWSAN